MSDRRDLPEPGPEDDDLGTLDETEIEDAGDDAEGEGDDLGEDAGRDDGQEEEAQEVVEQRPRTRGENRFQRLASENADLRRRFEELERNTRAQPAQPDPQAAARAEQEFWDSLSLMEPSAALKAVRDRERQQFGAALAQQEARMLDRQDRAEWNRLCREDRRAQRLSATVEQMVGNARAQGNYALDRETAFTYALGNELRRRGAAEAPRQRAAAARRVRGQAVRPVNGRGDTPRGGRSRGDPDEELLRNATVGDFDL